MIDWLIALDKQLFLTLNHWRADWMDPIMLFLSAKEVWIPLYVGIIGLIIYQYRKKAILLVLALILSVVAADQITSGFMKPYFERYRPCHEPSLAKEVLTPGKCGGKYGYASSHAANTFAVAVFMFLLFENKRKFMSLLIVWAALVSYSRIYLGVHYPLDILTGSLVGLFCSYWIFKLAEFSASRLFETNA